MPGSVKSCLILKSQALPFRIPIPFLGQMHILFVQESDFHMSTRLVIDGNAVYEIDEDCLELQKKKSLFRDGKNAGNAGFRDRKAEDNGQGGK